MTYKETKEKGYTDIVYWKNEPIINPKTGNEFFSPEDAEETFKKLKTDNAKEIAEELEKIKENRHIDDDEVEFTAEYFWEIENYIWKDAACLDDLVYEEENGLPQSK